MHKNDLNCDSIRELFTGFIDDVLNEEEKDTIKNHLASCSPCSTKLKEIMQTITLVHNLSEVDPPPWFTQKIMSQIKQESRKENIFDKIYAFFTVGVLVKVFASVLVAVIAIFIYRLILPEPELIKIEHHTPLVHAEKQTNPPGESNPLPKPGKIQTAGRNSGMKQEERAGVKPSGDKSAHEPSMQGEPYPGSSSLLAGASAGAGSNKSPSAPTANQGQKGEVTLPQRSEPQITEAANRSAAIHKTIPVEIALTVHDLSAASPEVGDILKELNAKIISYQSLEKRELYQVEISSRQLTALIEKLKKLGYLNTKNIPSEMTQDILTIKIETTMSDQ